MSDRQQDVLSAIDATLDGALDDWTISSDAMRWNPRDRDVYDEDARYTQPGQLSETLRPYGYQFDARPPGTWVPVGEIGDVVTITFPDGSINHVVVTRTNEDGSIEAHQQES